MVLKLTPKYLLTSQRTCILGGMGSGKTQLAKRLIKHYNLRALIWTPNPQDFRDPDDKKYFTTITDLDLTNINDLGTFENIAKQLKMFGLIDLVMIDEGELVFKNTQRLDNFPKNFQYWYGNTRHYLGKSGKEEGLGMMVVSRDANAMFRGVFELSNQCFIFRATGSNIFKKLNDKYRRLGNEVEKLKIDKHDFIHIIEGYEPKYYDNSQDFFNKNKDETIEGVDNDKPSLASLDLEKD